MGAGGGGRTATSVDCIGDLAKCDNSRAVNLPKESLVAVAPIRLKYLHSFTDVRGRRRHYFRLEGELLEWAKQKDADDSYEG